MVIADGNGAGGLETQKATCPPDDLLAGYVGHRHFSNRGQTDSMLAQAQLLMRANSQVPFALGMPSFGLHEVGAVDAV